MSDKNGQKFLIGLSEILEYSQISKFLFYQFVELGFPARVVNNRWYSHKDNIDEYFKQFTRGGNKNIPLDAD